MAGFKPSEAESPMLMTSGDNPNKPIPHLIIFLWAASLLKAAAEFAM